MAGMTANDLARWIQCLIAEKKVPSCFYLKCFGKNLKSLPHEIGLLSSLADICLTSNELTSIPAEIGRLSNLDHLHVGRNKLTALPSEIEIYHG